MIYKRSSGIILFFLVSVFLFFSCENGESSSGSENSENSPSNNQVTYCRFVGTVVYDEEFYSPDNYVSNKKVSGKVSAEADGIGVPNPSDVSKESRFAGPDFGTPTFSVSASTEDGLTADPLLITGRDFEISLASGHEWTVTVSFTSGTETITDSFTKNITPADAFFFHEFFIVPDSETGTGTVQLSMNVSDHITFLKISGSGISGENTVSWPSDKMSFLCDGDSGSRFIEISADVPSGIYNLTLKFYDHQDGTIQYVTNQCVNVYNGMRTVKWKSGSTNSGLIAADGTFTLTDAHLAAFKRNVFFVGAGSSAKGTLLPGVTASDDNTGTAYSPFRNMEKAFMAIHDRNDPNADYTIFVNGVITPYNGAIANEVCRMDATDSQKGLNGMAKSITICGANGLDSSGIPKDELNRSLSPTGTGYSNGFALGVFCDVPVHVRNLKLCGACSSSYGGVAVAKGATLYIESGTLITSNVGKYGAGVTNYGTVYMTGGEISECKKFSTNSYGYVIYNYVKNSSDPIPVFCMTGGVIRNNTEVPTCIVYNYGGKFYMSGDALIGDDSKTTYATSSDCSNKASSIIQNTYYSSDTLAPKGQLYLGYKYDSNNPDVPVEATLNKGIMYNFASSTSDTSSGIIYSFQSTIKMNSGYIKNNGSNNVGAINISSTNTNYKTQITGGTITNNKGGALGAINLNCSTGCFVIGEKPYFPMTLDSDFINYYTSGIISISSGLIRVGDATILATIKPKTYTVGTQVITMINDTTYHNVDNPIFAVVDDDTSDNYHWIVNTSGCLEQVEN